MGFDDPGHDRKDFVAFELGRQELCVFVAQDVDPNLRVLVVGRDSYSGPVHDVPREVGAVV